MGPAAGIAVLLISGLAAADTAGDVYKAIGVPTASVLTGSVVSAPVLPGGAKQVVAITTYMTGQREKETAVNVRLDIFDRVEGRLVPLYTRDLGAEYPGGVGRGDIQLVDLDRDAVHEVIISFDSFAEPLISQRLGEVLMRGADGFRVAWFGPFEYDATREARSLPAERRDRYRRKIDIPATLRSRGTTLVFEKEMIAVAGDRLAEPQTVRESVTLLERSGSR